MFIIRVFDRCGLFINVKEEILECDKSCFIQFVFIIIHYNCDVVACSFSRRFKHLSHAFIAFESFSRMFGTFPLLHTQCHMLYEVWQFYLAVDVAVY